MRAMVLLVLLSACGTAAPGAWEVEHEESRGVLLSIWGSGPDDLWATGGQVDRGLVLHGDGTSWTEVEVPAPGLLWSVYGFSADDVYAIGAGGVLLYYDGVRWSRADSGTDLALYGLWGATSDDVWAVGGDPWGPAGGGVILRGRGTHFERVTDVPAGLLPSSFTKVYGTGPDDVLVVGTGGTILRWNGATWRRESVPTTDALVAVWGRGADDLYVVGGQAKGEILHYNGTGWSLLEGPSAMPGLSGVFTAPDRPVFVVGSRSYVLEIPVTGEAVRREMPLLDPRDVLHSVWGDASGHVYAVGGDLEQYPGTMRGVILRRR